MVRRGGRTSKCDEQGGVSPDFTSIRTPSTSSSSARDTPPASHSGFPEQGDSYFAQFPYFHEDLDASLAEEVTRLGIEEKWSNKEVQRRTLDAFDHQFALFFGTDFAKLDKWQEMCRLCLIDPVPLALSQCKKALKKTPVNIFNLLDHCRNPACFKLIVFTTFNDLHRYSVPASLYPLKRAKGNAFLQTLLRPLGCTKKKTAT